MDTANATVGTSSSSRDVFVHFTPAVASTNRPLTSFPPTVYTVDGPLPGGRYLAHPLAVLVEEDEGEFLASEPHYYIHASGSTVPEAIASFKRVLSGYLDDLASDEERLSEYLHKQLQYFRSVIKSS